MQRIKLLVQKIGEYWSIARTLGGESVLHQISLAALLVGVPLRKRLFGRRLIPLRLTFNKRAFIFNVRDGADIAVLREVFIDREYQIQLKSTPRKIIDIGSHIGASVAFFSCMYPAAIITAYEPDPENFVMLAENMRQFPNVTCCQAAVSASSGEVIFFKNKESSISSSLISRGGHEERIMVRSTAINDILQEEGIDVIKFDIEGGEYDMFASAEESMLPEVLIGEVHYDLMKKSKEDFLKLFPSHRYEEHLLSDHRSILFLYLDGIHPTPSY